MVSHTSYLYFGPHHAFGSSWGHGFSSLNPSLAPVFLSRLHAILHVSLQFCRHAVQEYQPVVHRTTSSILCLRSRLTQGRSALLETLIFGLRILTSNSRYSFRHSLLERSIAPYRYDFAALKNAPLPIVQVQSLASVSCFSPGHFRRRTSRPVSYYALFE